MQSLSDEEYRLAIDAATATIIDWEDRRLTEGQQIEAIALVAGWVRLGVDSYSGSSGHDKD